MRYIHKGVGDKNLNAQQVAYLDEIKQGSASTKAWDDFRFKKETTMFCLVEQYYLCAYSEISLFNYDLGMHLEHINLRSKDKYRIFDHNNIVVSALHSNKLKQLPKKQRLGGHYRGDKFDSDLFITPLTEDCKRYFHYRFDGFVEPALLLSDHEATRAKYTIEILNLNSLYLVNKRKNKLSVLAEVVDSTIDDDDLLDGIIESELCATDSRLPSFHSAVREFFGPRGERIIEQQCINCK